MELNIVFVLLLQLSVGFCDEIQTQNAGNVKLLSEKAYAKLFRERRRESKDLLNIISNEGAYERKYKLLEGAYQKLLTILQQTQTILKTSEYDPLVEKFPTNNNQLFDAITVTLENTCLFGEIVLHNPDISYRVLDSWENGSTWKDLVNWCIKFARHFNDRIIDENSQKLLWLTEQEINPEMRTADFTNPYRSTTEASDTKTKKKKPKKSEKGPRMVTRDEF